MELDNTLVPWKGITSKVSRVFPVLRSLSASSNYFKSLSHPMMDGLTSLTLEYNQFTMIWDIIILRQLESLEVLHLKGNKIASIDKPGNPLTSFHAFGKKVKYVDLSYNAIASWSFVDDLPQVFPGLEELRLSHNPIYEGTNKETGKVPTVEESYTLTLARLGNLKSLNFSKITPADRTDAEMFYLSSIGKELAKVPESEEHTVTSQHKRFPELCEKYGAPTVVRSLEGAVNPNFLEARLIKFTFYLPSGPQVVGKDKQENRKEVVTMVPGTQMKAEDAIVKVREIPKSFDVYRVKGITGQMFGVPPLKIRLIWETGEASTIFYFQTVSSKSFYSFWDNTYFSINCSGIPLPVTRIFKKIVMIVRMRKKLLKWKRKVLQLIRTAALSGYVGRKNLKMVRERWETRLMVRKLGSVSRCDETR